MVPTNELTDGLINFLCEAFPLYRAQGIRHF